MEESFRFQMVEKLVPNLLYDFGTYESIVKDNDYFRMNIDRQQAKQELEEYKVRIEFFVNQAKL